MDLTSNLSSTCVSSNVISFCSTEPVESAGAAAVVPSNVSLTSVISPVKFLIFSFRPLSFLDAASCALFA